MKRFRGTLAWPVWHRPAQSANKMNIFTVKIMRQRLCAICTPIWTMRSSAMWHWYRESTKRGKQQKHSDATYTSCPTKCMTLCPFIFFKMLKWTKKHEWQFPLLLDMLWRENKLTFAIFRQFPFSIRTTTASISWLHTYKYMVLLLFVLCVFVWNETDEIALRIPTTTTLLRAKFLLCVFFIVSAAFR